MKKILVTGSTGFVGQNLTAFLTQKAIGAVEAINLREPLPVELAPADSIIHLAGKAHDLKNVSNCQEYFDVNYGFTKELFDRFLTSDIRDFIYFSSVKAVTDTVDGILSEETPSKPQTAYGQSKQKAEEYLLSKTLPSGKRVVIFRPCMIHGPGNKGNLNLLYKVVRKGIPYPLGAFDNRRSFLSIDNLLFIVEKTLTDSSISGGVYNLADDEPLATSELIRLIAKASGNTARIWKVPPPVINFMAKTGDLIKLPLNTERLSKLIENYVVDNRKIKTVLGVNELPLSSREGLVKTIESFSQYI